MKTTCLVNNYNYGRYVGEALDSVFRQTLAFDEVVIVDDGSTDGSREIILEKIAGRAHAQLIAKENGGQMSAFNAGFSATSGDIVFFLDSDDVYEDCYLEEAMAFYRQHPECDFLFCGMSQFGNSHQHFAPHSQDLDFGDTAIRTFFHREYHGAATSANSVRREILDQILPYPNTDDLRICADLALVHGASLVGARKFYLSRLLVRYRVHAQNGWCNTLEKKPECLRANDEAVERLCHHLLERHEGLLSLDRLLQEFRKAPRRRVRKVLDRYLAQSSRAGLDKILWRLKIQVAYYFYKLLGHCALKQRTSEPKPWCPVPV